MKHLALHKGDNAEASLTIAQWRSLRNESLGSRQKHSFTQ